ncbi:hypothetical protein BURMUCGD1_3959 [Burkholderia multivorans CGD1]|nr:hypothetical protein BURMUCGD1_3959 [Burkholderia multivorans CGD1]
MPPLIARTAPFRLFEYRPGDCLNTAVRGESKTGETESVR